LEQSSAEVVAEAFPADVFFLEELPDVIAEEARGLWEAA
jgi:hypothetical protein